MDRSGNPEPVSTESEENEILQLEVHILTLEQKIETSYYQLGKSIFELTDRRVDEINQLVNRLIETKARLRDLQSGSPCAVCGAVNAPGGRFCSQCGSDLEQEGSDQE